MKGKSSRDTSCSRDTSLKQQSSSVVFTMGTDRPFGCNLYLMSLVSGDFPSSSLLGVRNEQPRQLKQTCSLHKINANNFTISKQSCESESCFNMLFAAGTLQQLDGTARYCVQQLEGQQVQSVDVVMMIIITLSGCSFEQAYGFVYARA